MSDKKKGEKNTKDPSLAHLDINTADAASATDFTGLIPANPEPDDMETYNDIHGFGSETVTKIRNSAK